MTLLEFAKIVEKMRSLQKECSHTKDANTLKESKKAEKEVDAILARIEEYKKGASLF